jgi:hypothetical protein
MEDKGYGHINHFPGNRCEDLRVGHVPASVGRGRPSPAAHRRKSARSGCPRLAGDQACPTGCGRRRPSDAIGPRQGFHPHECRGIYANRPKCVVRVGYIWRLGTRSAISGNISKAVILAIVGSRCGTPTYHQRPQRSKTNSHRLSVMEVRSSTTGSDNFAPSARSVEFRRAAWYATTRASSRSSGSGGTLGIWRPLEEIAAALIASQAAFPSTPDARIFAIH